MTKAGYEDDQGRRWLILNYGQWHDGTERGGMVVVGDRIQLRAVRVKVGSNGWSWSSVSQLGLTSASDEEIGAGGDYREGLVAVRWNGWFWCSEVKISGGRR